MHETCRSGRSRPVFAMHGYNAWQLACSAVVGIADGARTLDNGAASRLVDARPSPLPAIQAATEWSLRRRVAKALG